LSDRCGTAAPALEFAVGDQGKPALVGHPEVDFNLSHADATAVVAVTDGCAVGVDVEADNPGIARSGIAEHFFAPGEVDHLQSLPADVQDHAFLECWTRKEAYLKGKGGGLSLPLDEFEVSFGPDRPTSLIRADRDPSDCGSWSLVDLTRDAPGGFVAALAVHAPDGGFDVDVIGERQRSCT
jgi:4'-phosphopantetheinyl transferase